MEPAVSRGDTDLKINSMPQAIVACVGLVCVTGVTIALALAGWSGEAIVAFAGLAAAMVAGQFVQTRRAAVVEAKTDRQTETLDTIVRQTNGMSEEDRERLADEAADRAAVRVIAAYRRGELG